MAATKLSRTHSMPECVEDTLSAHRNEIVSLLSRMPNEVEQEMLKGFIMNLCHVKELNIGVYYPKVVSCLQAKGFIFPSNVKFHY
ncbi:hypothetical protein L2E82_10724 [Cichorium intybus]|uniref:Uncharacterized protein n=1 Tax=Cichorium intybus TaxID=13427 RepID=A0ACB9GCD0_CICIN|nr:hypothetical protein L2E82_10724 [Cichorium intybus]